MTSEDSIHMVPFQFDLIQLLPNCQQVELFFFTFSAGIVHLNKSSNQWSCYETDSKTDKKSVICCSLFSSVVENEDHIPGSPSLPNDLLLNLFHNSLEQELSDKEVPLGDSDHSAFMHHILERERDGHVAPFSPAFIKGQCEALRLICHPYSSDLLMPSYTPVSVLVVLQKNIWEQQTNRTLQHHSTLPPAAARR